MFERRVTKGRGRLISCPRLVRHPRSRHGGSDESLAFPITSERGACSTACLSNVFECCKKWECMRRAERAAPALAPLLRPSSQPATTSQTRPNHLVRRTPTPRPYRPAPTFSSACPNPPASRSNAQQVACLSRRPVSETALRPARAETEAGPGMALCPELTASDLLNAG